MLTHCSECFRWKLISCTRLELNLNCIPLDNQNEKYMKHITKQRFYEITKLPNTTMLNFITMQANFETMDGYNTSIDWLIEVQPNMLWGFYQSKKHHKQLFLRSQSVDISLLYIQLVLVTLLTLHEYIYIYIIQYIYIHMHWYFA